MSKENLQPNQHQEIVIKQKRRKFLFGILTPVIIGVVLATALQLSLCKPNGGVQKNPHSQKV